MLIFARIAFIFLFISGCVISDNNSNDKDILADINGLSVSVDHFQNAFKEYYYRTGQVLTPTESTRREILDTQFETYVLAVHAMDLELDQLEESIHQKAAIERRVITDEYLKQVILGEVEVTDQDMREYFGRFNSSLRASHLYASTKEDADQLYERLQSGESFEDLAKEVFQNSYMANNGGDIGRFTTDDLDIAFENVAYSLDVGEVSKPVQTAQGYSIIKLTDRVVRPIITENEFYQNIDQLRSYTRKKKEEVATRDHLNDFLESASIDDSVFEEMFELMYQNPEGLYNKEPEFVTNLNNAGDVLLTSNAFEFKVEDFVVEYLASTPIQISTIQDVKSLDGFIKGVAYRSYLVQQAFELEIDKQRIVQESIDETYYHFLETAVMNELKSQIDITAAELYQTFNENKNGFSSPLKVSVQRLVLDSEEIAKSLLKEIKNGADFTSTVKEYSVNNEDLFTDGYLGFTDIESFGFNSTKIANLEINEVSEIISYSSNEFHIYKMIDREESREQTYSEAEESVREFLIQKKLKLLRAQTIEEVKLKHNAVIDIAKLNALTIQI